ncbi:unnamed protein product, partial [Rotaria sp. Silwood1]
LFREKNPQLLERKDRGKPTEFQRELVPLGYGQLNPKSYLDGAEILEQHIDDQDKQSNDELDEEEQSSEEDWIDVSHSNDDDDDDDDDDKEVDNHDQNDDQQNTDK